MSKFTCLVLCVVAASISKVYASFEQKAAFREAAKPIILECSKEHGVSFHELKAAKQAGSADGINPCFMGCVYKKAGVINDKGDFDLDNSLIKLKEFVSNDEEFSKFSDIGKQCTSVNEKAVSDGEAGCERAALLTACFLEHRAEVINAQSLRDALRPIIVVCTGEHGVTDADIQAAKDAGNAASIKPCFYGCVFKKAGFISDKGDYDVDTGLKNLRQFVKDDEQYNNLADVAKNCTSVNDKAVGDGTAGCERAALMASCFLEYRANIII